MRNPLIEAAIYALGGSNLEKCAICVTDRCSFVKYCNTAFSDIFGFQLEDMIGRHLSEIMGDDTHGHGTIENPHDMRVNIKPGESYEYKTESVFLAKNKNGDTFYMYLKNISAGFTGAGEFIMQVKMRRATDLEIASHGK